MNGRGLSLCTLALLLTIVGCDSGNDDDVTGTDPTGAAPTDTEDTPEPTTGDPTTSDPSTGDPTGDSGPTTTMGDAGSSSSGDDSTTGEAPTDVNPPCIDPRLGVVLPDAVVQKADGSVYAQTAVEARDDITATVAEVGGLPFPDGSSTPAEVDDITVFEGDVAYRWSEYLYVGRGEGYSIYRDDGGLIPDEIIFVDQHADCSRFGLTHYASEGDPSGAEEGDALLFFAFNQAGTAKDFAWSHWDPDSTSFTMREFEDLSGDFQRNVDGQADLSLSWNAEGEGSFTRFENGAQVESDLW